MNHRSIFTACRSHAHHSHFSPSFPTPPSLSLSMTLATHTHPLSLFHLMTTFVLHSRLVVIQPKIFTLSMPTLALHDCRPYRPLPRPLFPSITTLALNPHHSPTPTLVLDDLPHSPLSSQFNYSRYTTTCPLAPDAHHSRYPCHLSCCQHPPLSLSMPTLHSLPSFDQSDPGIQ
jgi:hypothetical protein